MDVWEGNDNFDDEGGKVSYLSFTGRGPDSLIHNCPLEI